MDFPGSSRSKESACQRRRRRFDPWVGTIPWSRKWQLTLVFLPGKFQTEGPGGLQYMGLLRVGHNWASARKGMAGQLHNVSASLVFFFFLHRMVHSLPWKPWQSRSVKLFKEHAEPWTQQMKFWQLSGHWERGGEPVNRVLHRSDAIGSTFSLEDQHRWEWLESCSPRGRTGCGQYNCSQ